MGNPILTAFNPGTPALASEVQANDTACAAELAGNLLNITNVAEYRAEFNSGGRWDRNQIQWFLRAWQQDTAAIITELRGMCAGYTGMVGFDEFQVFVDTRPPGPGMGSAMVGWASVFGPLVVSGNYLETTSGPIGINIGPAGSGFVRLRVLSVGTPLASSGDRAALFVQATIKESHRA